MPIEIRELNIKVNVSNNQGAQPGTNQGQIPGKEEIIAECIERVMEILKNKNER